MPRLSLRWKILLFTVPPLVVLAVAALMMVERNLTAQADRQLRDDLQRSSALFENMLHARTSALVTAGSVIVRDPKFFSVLDLGLSPKDPQFRATVAGVAADFEHITLSEVFEVLDARGHLLASVGSASTSDAGRQQLVHSAITGGLVNGLLVEPEGQFQAVAMPVFSGGRIAGVLLLGSEVGHQLASELCDLTRSDVTFFSGNHITGSTLTHDEDKDAAREAMQQPAASIHDGAQSRALASNRIREILGSEHTWLTLVSTIPGTLPADRQNYVMQRSLDLETAVLREVRDRLITLGGLTIVLALLAGLAIAHGLNAPIQRMVRAAEAMERGDYEFPLEVNSNDELGYLSERFHEMRSQQRDLVSSLQETARVRREFISVASHELRTPISVIQGFQELLISGAMGQPTDAQRRALEAIQRSVHTLARIAADATRMSQIQDDKLTLSPSSADAEQVLAVAKRDALAAARGREVEVKCIVEDGPLHFRADVARVSDALANLIRNGVRFTPDGGHVVVRARREGDRVLLEVQDDGVGIAPERLKMLLDKHAPVRDSLHHHSSSTLEFNSAGLGLGLSITRGIVEAHGGVLRAESREGQGSLFTIDLPDTGAAALAMAA
jgi:signal transduction histidine kinase